MPITAITLDRRRCIVRHHQRITDTRDLLVSLRASERRYGARRVLNLSEGGMLVAGEDLQVGETATFEIAGPYFRYTGTGEVAHRTNGAMGVRFVRWHGQAARPIRALIATRIRQGRTASQQAGVPATSRTRRLAVFVGAERAGGPITPVRKATR